MCNRVAVDEKGELVVISGPQLGLRFKVDKRYKVSPSEPIPIIRVIEDQLQTGAANFGFASGPHGRQLMARGETVDRKPMFKHAFTNASRRCIAVVRGFYDSVDQGRKKQPWFIHRKDGGRMGFASLLEERPDEENLCIVSCVPNRVVRPVIDRMPVILPLDHWAAWLDPKTPPEALKAMLVPYPADEMEAYPVTPNVNKRGFDGPECIQRIEPEQPEFGLDLFGS